MLPFRLFQNHSNQSYPLSLYSCGLHEQTYQNRPIGYPTLQCFINYEGAGVFHFAGQQSVVLEAGQALLVPGKLAHEYYPEQDSTWIVGYMGINGYLVESIISSSGIPILSPILMDNNQLQESSNILYKMWHSHYDDEQNANRYISVQLYEYLIVLSNIVAKKENSSSIVHSTPSTHALQRAVHLMQQHYNENIRIANIAYAVGYSVQHFQRLFREMYGVNPLTYLQRLRLEQAILLLESKENNHLTIQEISNLVGMDTNYFIRLFKREHGITPAQYRLRYHQYS
ncbi:helix-turn-helix domain-containing protein [Paenibacillus endoradicis]|uniref:helix-turn-helix domain-containing protein n=1 Tax=Paenibacillus endoradicis TaxID=2972487 RepID=UPI0021599A64|nr:AraC family transcriptional regulator [Paenibacillus endoradicis]MCR8659989.1 AraC family transcriptional regulator [Paenibacillus endoradicis]